VLRLGWSSAAALALSGTRLKANSAGGRVLVHLNLFGGNDSNNMLVPMDAAGYRNYEMARGPVGIPFRELWPVQAPSSSSAFGMPRTLGELRYLYERKTVAIVANTGYLPAPMTKPQVLQAGIPAGAINHLTAQIAYVKDGAAVPAWSAAAMEIRDHPELLARAYVLDNGVAFLSEAAVAGHTVVNDPGLVKALASAQVRNPFPKTDVGRSLQKTAQLIHASAATGIASPVILCSASQFDTHFAQGAQQPALYRDLSAALMAFQIAMEEMGAAQRVTLYTQTEFNRSLAPNAAGGTEHAWGGHEIVMGGAVAGGDVYGTFPSLELKGPDDVSGNGTLLPSTSHLQYGATLAAWLGYGAAQQRRIFQGLEQFPTPNLKFLG
jgi:uncharacterized protein (DUF1501 family)